MDINISRIFLITFDFVLEEIDDGITFLSRKIFQLLIFNRTNSNSVIQIQTRFQLKEIHQLICNRFVQVDFEVPVGASAQATDAAMLAALAQKMQIDYLAIGQS